MCFQRGSLTGSLAERSRAVYIEVLLFLIAEYIPYLTFLEKKSTPDADYEVRENGTVMKLNNIAGKLVNTRIQPAAVLLAVLLCAAGAPEAAADQSPAVPPAVDEELDWRMLESVGGIRPEDSTFGRMQDRREDADSAELHQLVEAFFASLHTAENRWKDYVDPEVMPFFAQMHNQLLTEPPRPQNIRLGEFLPDESADGENGRAGEFHVRIITAAGKETVYRIIVSAADSPEHNAGNWNIYDIMQLIPGT